MINEEILIKNYKDIFKSNPTNMIDTGGRFEICGNHTDHNHGYCIVANSSLRVYAALGKNNDKVCIQSKGYPYFEFDVNKLEKLTENEHKPIALVKGVLFKLKELGYKVGGFNAYIESEIPDGSGVSSSAAMESLFGYIISYLYNDGIIEPLIIAKTGQFSENVYFNKPCGLLDQVGTSFDSSNFIDFKNIDNPEIINLPFKLPLTLFLVKSIGDHSNLTPLYAAIPNSMYEVANLLEGKKYLRDVSDENIFDRIDKLNVSDEVKRKAKHFFIENDNVLLAKKAILNNDVGTFFDAIRKSQLSSKNDIENTFVKGEYTGSPQEIIDKAEQFLKDNGAIRIHGGGFKGTVLAFVKNEFANSFEDYLKANYEKDRYFRVNISNKAIHYKNI